VLFFLQFHEASTMVGLKKLQTFYKRTLCEQGRGCPGMKNSGHTLIFRASASCSKILNATSIFNTGKNSGQTIFLRAGASCSKL